MDESVFRNQMKRVEQIEKRYGSLEEYALLSTFGTERHRLILKEPFLASRQEMEQVYQDLSDLELAELYDAQNLVGRFDGEFD